MVESLVDVLDSRAQSENGRLNKQTYPEIYQSSLRLSSWLRHHDIQPGDRIMLWGSNSPQWVISYFACLRAGATVVPFDVNRESSFLSRVIGATQPRFIIAGEAQRNSLPADNAVPIFDMEQADKISGEDDNQTRATSSADDPAEIVFTSGTTGNPKGVVLTHGNILTNIESIQKVVPIKPYYRLLSILPLSHMFETTVGLLVPMASGASVVYAETLQPANILQVMRAERITCMAVVPQALQLFKRGIEQQVAKIGKERQFHFMNNLSPYLPESVRRVMFRSIHERMGGQFEFFVCGGARLDPAVGNFWENLGIKVLQGYGMTEASPVVSCDSMSDRDHQYVGRPLPGVDVRIADDNEVLVRGLNVMRGYWNNQSATREALRGGWYHTGDLGALSKGRLRLLGRKGDMIVLSNGLNVYPEDIEQVLVQEGIQEAVVFCRQVREKEELHAVLLLSGSQDPGEIIRTANRHLSSHQRIKGWTVWKGEDFPRTHTLKPKRAEIIREIKD